MRDITSAFSLPHLRSFYRRALLAPNPGTRDLYLSHLFFGLGHMVHLLQDMAQPEHTRNDQHLTFDVSWLDALLFGPTAPSIWERWGGNNLVEREVKHGGTRVKVPPVVSYDDYPTVRLPHYKSYFHTTDGKGLADFSNRSFVTQDTNYSDMSITSPLAKERCYEYRSPSLPRTFRIETVAERIIDDFGNVSTKPVEERIYTSTVADNYALSVEPDPFHTYSSLLDLETRKYGVHTYSLGDGSYLSRASMLIPRAVGYSAGLVEHFFRGSIDAFWLPSIDGTYALTIKNRSSDAIGADARIAAVYRATPAYFGRSTSDDTAPIVDATISSLSPGFEGLEPGRSVTILVEPRFLRPSDSVLQFERRIAITGTLGGSRMK